MSDYVGQLTVKTQSTGYVQIPSAAGEIRIELTITPEGALEAWCTTGRLAVEPITGNRVAIVPIVQVITGPCAECGNLARVLPDGSLQQHVFTRGTGTIVCESTKMRVS